MSGLVRLFFYIDTDDRSAEARPNEILALDQWAMRVEVIVAQLRGLDRPHLDLFARDNRAIACNQQQAQSLADIAGMRCPAADIDGALVLKSQAGPKLIMDLVDGFGIDPAIWGLEPTVALEFDDLFDRKRAELVFAICEVDGLDEGLHYAATVRPTMTMS